MKVEHLFEIAKDLRADMKNTKLTENLEALVNALQDQINSPSQENLTTLSSIKEATISSLKASRVISYSHSWVEDMEEMNLRGYFGNELIDSINSIFSQNQITLTDALTELTELRDEMVRTEKHLVSLISAFTYLTFKPENLPAGEFEISIKIPRAAISNEVKKLGVELEKIEKILNVFSEIVTGDREAFKLKSISTSDPTVILHSLPAVAAAIAVALERCVAIYNGVLDLIVKHKELSDKKVPKKILDDLKAHITQTIEKGIRDVGEELLKDYGSRIDSTRKNELTTELNKSLTAIAKRLDAGYGFDVRGEVVDDAETETNNSSGQSEKSHSNEYYKIVQESRLKIIHFKSGGEPILGLDSPANKEE